MAYPPATPGYNQGTDAQGTEDAVFQIAVELINQTNRPLKINDLFQQAVSRLGISPAQANSCIASLLKKKMVVEGSKLTQNDVLTNELRARIYDYITKNPGVHVRDVRREMGIDNAESAWHLAVLEKFGFLRKKRIGKYLCYYLPSIGEEWDETLCMLHHDTTYRVFYDIFVNQNTTIPEVAQRVGIDPSTVKYHVDKLASTTLVYNTNSGQNPERYAVHTDMWTAVLQLAPGFSG